MQKIVSSIGDQLSTKAIKYLGNKCISYKGRDEGNNPKIGFDCSGFIYFILKNEIDTKISLKISNTKREIRHSEEIFDHLGILIHDGFQRKGDIVVFSYDLTRPSHVGIYLGDGKMIHSPGTNI